MASPVNGSSQSQGSPSTSNSRNKGRVVLARSKDTIRRFAQGIRSSSLSQISLPSISSLRRSEDDNDHHLTQQQPWLQSTRRSKRAFSQGKESAISHTLNCGKAGEQRVTGEGAPLSQSRESLRPPSFDGFNFSLPRQVGKKSVRKDLLSKRSFSYIQTTDKSERKESDPTRSSNFDCLLNLAIEAVKLNQKYLKNSKQPTNALETNHFPDYFPSKSTYLLEDFLRFCQGIYKARVIELFIETFIIWYQKNKEKDLTFFAFLYQFAGAEDTWIKSKNTDIYSFDPLTTLSGLFLQQKLSTSLLNSIVDFINSMKRRKVSLLLWSCVEALIAKNLEENNAEKKSIEAEIARILLSQDNSKQFFFETALYIIRREDLTFYLKNSEFHLLIDEQTIASSLGSRLLQEFLSEHFEDFFEFASHDSTALLPLFNRIFMRGEGSLKWLLKNIFIQFGDDHLKQINSLNVIATLVEKGRSANFFRIDQLITTIRQVFWIVESHKNSIFKLLATKEGCKLGERLFATGASPRTSSPRDDPSSSQLLQDFLRYLKSQGKDYMEEALLHFLENEIEKASSGIGSLFRGATIFNNLLKEYFYVILPNDRGYLCELKEHFRSSIDIVRNSIAASQPLDNQPVVSGIDYNFSNFEANNRASQPVLQVSAEQREQQDSVKENARRIWLNWFNGMLAFLSNKVELPSVLSDFFGKMAILFSENPKFQSMVEKEGKNKKKVITVLIGGGFLFLRKLCPALATGHFWSKAEWEADSDLQQQVKTCGGVLQAFSNYTGGELTEVFIKHKDRLARMGITEENFISLSDTFTKFLEEHIVLKNPEAATHFSLKHFFSDVEVSNQEEFVKKICSQIQDEVQNSTSISILFQNDSKWISMLRTYLDCSKVYLSEIRSFFRTSIEGACRSIRNKRGTQPVTVMSGNCLDIFLIELYRTELPHNIRTLLSKMVQTLSNETKFQTWMKQESRDYQKEATARITNILFGYLVSNLELQVFNEKERRDPTKNQLIRCMAEVIILLSRHKTLERKELINHGIDEKRIPKYFKEFQTFVQDKVIGINQNFVPQDPPKAKTHSFKFGGPLSSIWGKDLSEK